MTIEAGQAFGSGEHPSTALALRLLSNAPNLATAKQVLDIGCGSGVLTIAAARLTQATILAADIVSEAVAATARNAERNGVSRRVEAIRSDGYGAPIIQARRPYDVIVCNVLSQHAIRWARELSSCLAQDGYAVVSGILSWQCATVKEALEGVGLACVSEIGHRDWRALALQKASR